MCVWELRRSWCNKAVRSKGSQVRAGRSTQGVEKRTLLPVLTKHWDCQLQRVITGLSTALLPFSYIATHHCLTLTAPTHLPWIIYIITDLLV